MSAAAAEGWRRWWVVVLGPPPISGAAFFGFLMGAYAGYKVYEHISEARKEPALPDTDRTEDLLVSPTERRHMTIPPPPVSSDK